MNRLEHLRADVQAQLSELSTVVDEFEQTVEDFERTVTDSKFNDIGGAEQTGGGESASAVRSDQNSNPERSGTTEDTEQQPGAFRHDGRYRTATRSVQAATEVSRRMSL